MYVRFGVGELPALGAARLAGLIEQNHAELKAAECRMLQLACAWADAHVRREALFGRLEVRDLHRRLVAARRWELRAA
jgi:hypothetical protein